MGETEESEQEQRTKSMLSSVPEAGRAGLECEEAVAMVENAKAVALVHDAEDIEVLGDSNEA